MQLHPSSDLQNWVRDSMLDQRMLLTVKVDGKRRVALALSDSVAARTPQGMSRTACNWD
jgi:hypothetical protein